jgi:hypothetical protein
VVRELGGVPGGDGGGRVHVGVNDTRAGARASLMQIMAAARR